MERNKTLERVGGFSTDLRHEVESGSLFSRQRLASMLAVIAILSPSDGFGLEQTGVDTFEKINFDTTSSVAKYSEDGSLDLVSRPTNGVFFPMSKNYAILGEHVYEYATGNIVSLPRENGVSTRIEAVLSDNKVIVNTGVGFKFLKTNNYPSVSYESIPVIDSSDDGLLPLWNINKSDGSHNTVVVGYVGSLLSGRNVHNVYLFKSDGQVVKLPSGSYANEVNATMSHLDSLRVQIGYVGNDMISYYRDDSTNETSNAYIYQNLERDNVVSPDEDMGLDMGVSDMGAEEMGGVDMSFDMAVEGTDDMGIIVEMARLDMGNSNNDMGVGVVGDLGLEDMSSGVVKTNESKGDSCTVVNPTAPMHKTPGGLTLLFASALTVAAGFRKKGKKSE